MSYEFFVKRGRKVGKKVMVVDDSEEVVKMVKAALGKEGYTVVGARDGYECLEKLSAEKPDLILLDVMMPGIDGWEVCKKIKESELILSMPISMLTVKKGRNDIKKSLDYAHADGHLAKPLNIKELRKAVRDLLNSA